MSSSDGAPPPESQFGTSLEAARRTLRRSDLRTRLREQSDLLSEYILLRELYEALSDESHSPDEELASSIRRIRTQIDARDFSSMESDLDELESNLSSERQNLVRAIDEQCIAVLNTLGAMETLNDRVGNVDPGRIDELATRFDSLTDLEFLETDDLSEQRKEVPREVTRLEGELQSVQEEVFGQFYGTELEEIVRRLLDDETFRIDDLSTDQFERLQESELADCLELMLS